MLGVAVGESYTLTLTLAHADPSLPENPLCFPIPCALPPPLLIPLGRRPFCSNAFGFLFTRSSHFGLPEAPRLHALPSTCLGLLVSHVVPFPVIPVPQEQQGTLGENELCSHTPAAVPHHSLEVELWANYPES